MSGFQNRRALFLCGEDVVTLLALNQLIPTALQLGFEPVLAFVKHRLAYKPERGNIPELQRLGFVERGILSETIFPFVDGHDHASADKQYTLTPRQLGNRYGLTVETVADANEAIARYLTGENPPAVIQSLRCTQIISPESIRLAGAQGVPLVNIHPGPTTTSGTRPRAMKGLMAPYWDMAHRMRHLGATVHHVDEGIDTGNVIAIKHVEADYKKSQFENAVSLAPTLADLATTVLTTMNHGDVPVGTAPTPGDYHTIPTAQDLEDWKHSGLVLHPTADKLADIYARLFARRPNGIEGKIFNGELTAKIASTFKEHAAFKPQVPTKPQDTPRQHTGSRASFIGIPNGVALVHSGK